MCEFIPRKLNLPIELYSLIQTGVLVAGKSKLKTTKGIFTFMKLVHRMNLLHVVLEDKNGVSYLQHNSI